MKTALLGMALLLTAPAFAQTQRPDTVFFEDLTFDEVRDAIRGGARNVIVAVGGSEDGGDRLTTGAPTDIATVTADRIARAVGHTLVAPVIAYAPGGVIPLPAEAFAGLVEAAATSAKASGFTNVFLLATTAAAEPGLKAVATRLESAWKADGVHVVHVSGVVTGTPATDSAAELLAINSQRVRIERLGTERAPTPQQGVARLTARVEQAVSHIKAVLSPTAAVAPASRPGGGLLPTPDPRAAPSPSLFLEDLTRTEIREAIAAGRRVVVVPTGGTEKNGFHMALGKHNFHVRAGAELMAKRLGNALIAPVLQYVPESQATESTPGVLSCARECFDQVVDGIARGVRQLGFTEVVLIGDNGGNQAPLKAVAERLTAAWKDTGARAFALTDFYDKGHEYQDVWFLSQFGWEESVVGSHAGIKDTSQMLYVKPQDVRTNRIADSFANKQESGVSGDPTKATAEFGRVGIEFKVNGALAQYKALKAAIAGDEGSSSGGRSRRGSR